MDNIKGMKEEVDLTNNQDFIKAISLIENRLNQIENKLNAILENTSPKSWYHGWNSVIAIVGLGIAIYLLGVTLEDIASQIAGASLILVGFGGSIGMIFRPVFQGILRRSQQKVGFSAVHDAGWSGNSLTILFGLAAIPVTIISYAIFELVPLSIPVKCLIWLVVIIVLIAISWWQRYHLLMFIRWLERKMRSKKTYS